jgi:hypothetical protein
MATEIFRFEGDGVTSPRDADGDGLPDQWETGYFRSTACHDALDDYDGDGYVELMELALGLNPTQPDPGGQPPVTTEGDYLTMTLRKQCGVDYEIQSAGTLDTGRADSFESASTTVLVDDATTLTVRDNVPLGGAPGRFMRLKVIAAPHSECRRVRPAPVELPAGGARAVVAPSR